MVKRNINSSFSILKALWLGLNWTNPKQTRSGASWIDEVNKNEYVNKRNSKYRRHRRIKNKMAKKVEGSIDMNRKIEIIAEIGINHNGNLKIAEELIVQASAAGADVAKFQLYDPRKLLKPADFIAQDWESILCSQLSFDETKKLKEICDGYSIEFLASAFDVERLQWLENLNVKRYKIASRSVYDEEIAKFIAGTYKDVLVSYGMIEYDEDPLIFEYCGHRSVERLYCVPQYPALLESIRFNRDMFNYEYHGFSDHTIGITAAMTAIVLGAEIVEKHFTYDKQASGPDHCCSIEFEELRRLCKFRDEFLRIGAVDKK